MHLSYTVPPSDLLWTEDLFAYIQAFKAGTFDSSAVYEQNGWLVVPEVEAHGTGGPFTAYFAIKAGDSVTPFSIFNPLTDVAVWTVVNHAPDTNILAASGLDLAFLDVFAATSARALEKLIFSGDDLIDFTTAAPDTSSDQLNGWGGNDTISAPGSGGTDVFHGGDGNDRITVYNGLVTPGSGQFLGYGDAGRDTVIGDERADLLFGGKGHDSLVANGGDDLLQGGTGRDSLQGGADKDTVDGGAGDDVLFAGLGADLNVGAGGDDLFVFTWGGADGHFDSGTGAAARDTITDFVRGADLIRLVESALDTITLIGAAAFSGENQVRWVSNGTNTTIFINGDGDLAADMAILLQGVTQLDAGDFQLA